MIGVVALPSLKIGAGAKKARSWIAALQQAVTNAANATQEGGGALTDPAKTLDVPPEAMEKASAATIE